MWHHYRRLIGLRHTMPVVSHGDFSLLLPDDPAIYAFTRRLGQEELLVVANFTGKTTPLDLPDLTSWAAAELILGNLESDASDADPDSLAPWEGAGTPLLRRVLPRVR